MWSCYKACVSEFFGEIFTWRAIFAIVACLLLGLVSLLPTGPGAAAVIIGCLGVTVVGSIVTGFIACLAMCK